MTHAGNKTGYLSKIRIFRGDITTLKVDAIVNAANTSLLGGAGVDGAIHRAAGPGLLEENKRKKGGCPEGRAVVSKGYNLPAKHVISTVGPRGENKEVLGQAYTSCFDRVKEYGIKSVAFPCISTGIYGYPNEKAADVALRSTVEFIEKNGDKIEEVIFCVFLDVDEQIYEQKMKNIRQGSIPSAAVGLAEGNNNSDAGKSTQAEDSGAGQTSLNTNFGTENIPNKDISSVAVGLAEGNNNSDAENSKQAEDSGAGQTSSNTDGGTGNIPNISSAAVGLAEGNNNSDA